MPFLRKAGQDAVHGAATRSAILAVPASFAGQVQIPGTVGYLASVFVVVGAGQVIGQIVGLGKVIDNDAGVAVIREGLIVADRSEFIVHAVRVDPQLYGRDRYLSEFVRAGAGAEQDGGNGNQPDRKAAPDGRTGK